MKIKKTVLHVFSFCTLVGAIASNTIWAEPTIRNLSSPGGATIIFFDDPDGYDVELYQAVEPSE